MEHGQLLAFTGGPLLAVIAVPHCRATLTGHEALLASLRNTQGVRTARGKACCQNAAEGSR